MNNKKKRKIIGWITGGAALLALLTTLAFVVFPIKCNVSFNSNGGTAVETVQVNKYSKVDKPVSKKTGYKLKYWSYNDKEWDFYDNKVTKNITLDANWNPVKYSISYHLSSNESTSNPTKYTIEDEITLSSAECEETYRHFAYWKDANNNQVTKIEKGTTGDIDLYASWSYDSCNVTATIIGSDGDVTIDGTGYHEINSQVTLSLSNIDKYSANHWDLNGSAAYYDNSSINFTMPAHDMDFTVYVTKKIYSVTASTESSGFSVYIEGAGNYSCGDTVTLTASTGAIVERWYETTEEKEYPNTGSTLTFTMPAKNLSFKVTARYEVYNIYYIDELGADNSANPKTYTIMSGPTIYDVSYVGYKFLGWYDENDVKVEYIALCTRSGDLTLTAKWEKVDDHSVSVYTPSGLSLDVSGAGTHHYDEIVTITVLESEYNPTAWWGSDNTTYYGGNTKTVSFNMPDHDVTIYVHGNYTEYSITYIDELGADNSANPKTYTRMCGYDIVDVEYVGYKFLGWYNSNGEKVEHLSLGISYGNLVLTAKWEKVDDHSISVTFACGHFVGVTGEGTYKYNEIVTLKITDDDFNPTYWGESGSSTIYGGAYSTISFKMPDHDTTIIVYGDYTQYTITYIDELGADNSANPTTYDKMSGCDIVDVEYVGYKFLGWYNSKNEKVTHLSLGCSYGNLVLTAKWEKVGDHSVSVYTSNGTPLYASGEGTYKYNEVVTLTITEDDYHPTYWAENGSETIYGGANSTISFKMPDHDLNLIVYGNYTQYTITYIDELGADNSANPTTYDKMSGYTIYDVSYEGYEFLGWYDVNGTKFEYLALGCVYGNLVLTARWNKI